MTAVNYKFSHRKKARKLLDIFLAMIVIIAGTASSQAVAQEVEWTALTSDGEGDGLYSGVLDGKELSYRYDAVQDRLYFRIEVYSASFSASVIGINLVMFIPGDSQVAAWWGSNSSFRYNRLVTFWVQGSPPNNYTGTIGIANVAGVQQMRYMNLKQGNISANVDPQNNYYELSFARADLIDDEIFDAGPVTIDMIAAVGTNDFWNDDIPNSGNGTLTIEKPAAAKPEIEVSHTDIAFEQLEAGQSAAQTITISNPSTQMLRVEGIELEGDDSNVFSILESAPFNIAANSQKNITLRFEPAGAGEFAALLNIISNAKEPNAQLSVNISAAAREQEIDPPGINISQNHINFAATIRGEQTSGRLSVTNSGGSTLEINTIAISGAGQASFKLQSLAQLSLEPNQSADISVVFKPDAEGLQQAQLTLSSNAPAPDDEIVIDLSGQGLVNTTVRAEIFENDEITVFPNPASELVNINYSLQMTSLVSLRLVDARGTVIFESAETVQLPGHQKQRFKLADFNLPAGVFFLQVFVNQKQAAALQFMKL